MFEKLALADKLLDLGKQRADEIAECWYKAVSTNPRTTSYSSLDKDVLIRQAASFYSNLKELFFTGDPYREVQRFFDMTRFVEFAYDNGIPLHESVYALVLMRRHIWLYAEMQAILYNSALEIYQVLESVNRTILLFDYAIYLVTRRYGEMDRTEKV